MDMEKWIEDNAFEIDDGGDLIAVDDLLELLKTHTIVPKELLGRLNGRIKELEEHLRQAGENGSLNGAGEFVVNDAWFEQTEYLLAIGLKAAQENS